MLFSDCKFIEMWNKTTVILPYKDDQIMKRQKAWFSFLDSFGIYPNGKNVQITIYDDGQALYPDKLVIRINSLSG